MLPSLKFLVIEDDKFDYEIIVNELKRKYKKEDIIKNIVWAKSLKEGLAHLESQHFDIILLDLTLPDTPLDKNSCDIAQPLKVITKIQEKFAHIPVIVITGLDSEEIALKALKLGAQDYLVKGEFQNSLFKSIRFAIERKEMMEEVEEAKLSAQKASEAKSDFLANMSHEIRTPLTAILGFSEIAIHQAEKENKKSTELKSINQNAEHLLQIISDILDISKIEAGKLEVVKKPFRFQKMLSDLENSFKLKAKEKNISFGIEYAFPLPKVVYNDSVKIKQILYNVMGNAVKFTNSGGVKTQVSYSEETRRLNFKVIDTGIGLNKEEQQKIFYNFSQADSSTVRDYGGTGLGLSISKKLSEALGGKISLNSEKGKGSVFSISIPLDENDFPKFDNSFSKEKNSPSVNFKNSSSNLISGKVLLVDDMPDNRELLSCLLKPQGAELDFAENGRKAIEKVKLNCPSLILLDMQMPEMDGYETAERLRDMGHTLPIIAVTASATKNALEKTISSGCNEYICKPFKKNQLFSVLKKYIGLSQIIDHQSNISIHESNVLTDSPELASAVLSFVDHLPDRLDSIEDAFKNSHWSKLQTLAHRLAGAELFGYPKVGLVARTLEAAAANQEEQEIYSLINSLNLLGTKVIAERSSIAEMVDTISTQ